ncbi:glycosyl transferase group 1 [Halalkalicoccus jeotgali B3]|uniref:Glycosyl transferase group 1 n=1 Tax=Halalkalicoccus jeotgali (strain DSM 18796 / CECT 7217 / JCM 14584 / KCTC 4019 / B3) TaxID=795797 RepID=D8J5S2_HALJB|nr:glycosyl transferase group 1 [Halalkalicoccus jeotgali B3]
MTTPRSFFDQQVRALEERGVDCTVLEVPRPQSGRGPADFARFYQRVLGETVLGDYDLVHANYGLVGPLALAQPVRPVVLSIWGSEVMGFSDRLDRITRVAARHSDAVIAPSMPVSRELDRPHTVIPFGVDTDLFRPIDRDEARDYLGWDRDARIVLFPYDPDRPVKNHPLAKRVVDRLSVEAELRTVSGLAYEEMPYVMNASDALLVTSERESGPMVIKEAAACNLPVVSTDVGFARDVLAGVSNCYIGESAADLARGLDSILDRRIRTDSRATIGRLGVDEMGDRLLMLYTTLLRLDS